MKATGATARQDAADGGVSVLVGLGSNLGERRGNIERAVERLAALPGVRWLRLSSLRETEPLGGPPQGAYLNAAGELSTTLAPLDLLAAIERIEAELGRVRGERAVRWGPRTIDIDILVFGDRVIDHPRLQVPHPRMLERPFVLEPLAEIAPGRRHPVDGRTFRELWRGIAAPSA
jgi:2-amino-4-hydroxy-6-hydroxymethyldihydropteridine diphosphokinase